VAKYPRQKLVMTNLVEFPTSGKFKKPDELIEFAALYAGVTSVFVRTATPLLSKLTKTRV
jgi:hypothetical protein